MRLYVNFKLVMTPMITRDVADTDRAQRGERRILAIRN